MSPSFVATVDASSHCPKAKRQWTPTETPTKVVRPVMPTLASVAFRDTYQMLLRQVELNEQMMGQEWREKLPLPSKLVQELEVVTVAVNGRRSARLAWRK